MQKQSSIKRGGNGVRPHGGLGPIADLESHLPEDWWNDLFGALYIKTDGDVVENDVNTRREVDSIIEATGIEPGNQIIDLCCGQGRHSLELARRGYRHVIGIDRSRYLVRLARKRASREGLSVQFREGDARSPRIANGSQDSILVLGNSFGYFAKQEDDRKVLEHIARCLRSTGRLYLDVTDGQWIRENYEARSWEWIDKHHFVCRERSLSSDGDRLISREVVVHDERGVITDQFYAERLYTQDRLAELLGAVGFRDLRFHGDLASESDRGQDLGMMAHRMLFTAQAPRKSAPSSRRRSKNTDVVVALGDPHLPDPVKRDGRFNAEDFETIEKLKDALAEIPGYTFQFINNHATLARDLAASACDLVLNLCDEGLNNNAFMELHVPALLESLGIPYTGGGPACLAACYDKALVRAVAAAHDIPVPLETFARLGDQSATLPSVFPAIVKPNFGDSSVGITAASVVHSQLELIDLIERASNEFGDQPTLVQEFLTGAEFSVGLVGNPGALRPLPILEVDYSGLESGLPHLLGYESKWLPDSPYWSQIRYREAEIDDRQQSQLIEHSIWLFERLGCRDYGRFDFRAGTSGEIKLLEVNPNPGWCWDGKLNLMAGFAGIRYADLLAMILDSAKERLAVPTEMAPRRAA